MSKFNVKEKPNTRPSYEGAMLYEKDVVDDFVNNLFSNNFEDGFYEKGQQRLDHFCDLVSAVRNERGDAFVAKLAEFTRNEIGMRSAAQVVAGMLNDSKMDKKRYFYRSFCHRPDDVAEIFGFIESHGMKPSHAMVRGFSDYVSNLSEYQLGKYKMAGKRWNMYDIVNITHAHSDAIDKLKNDTLEPPDTWEVSISGSSDSKEKAKNWVRLVEERKLGYNALLMNLRNILAYAPSQQWVRAILCPQITSSGSIFKSLMFPYKIYNAYKNYNAGGMNIKNLDVERALAKAFSISCSLMPRFDGETLVVVDVSGSMQTPYSKMSSLSILEISVCYAAAFLLANPSNTTVIKFGTHAKKFEYSPAEDAFSLVRKLMDNGGLGYSTEIESVYNMLDRHYDRMILFSDMQVMEDHWNSVDAKNLHEHYCFKHGRCLVHSFDLGNYHTQIASTGSHLLRYFTSVSPQVFKFLSIVESGESIADYIDRNY